MHTRSNVTLLIEALTARTLPSAKPAIITPACIACGRRQSQAPSRIGPPWTPPGFGTPLNGLRKVGAVRGPGPAVKLAGFLKVALKTGQSHQVYPAYTSVAVPLIAVKSAAPGAPSAQLLCVPVRPPRAQILNVKEPVPKLGVTPRAGYS
jgi:hypothetical protein